jgi:hypothetical protein
MKEAEVYKIFMPPDWKFKIDNSLFWKKASKERLDRFNIAKDMVALAPSWDDKKHWLKVMRECADDISCHASADGVNEPFANIPALVGPSVPSAQFPGSFSIVGPPFDLVALNALRTDDEMISCSR